METPNERKNMIIKKFKKSPAIKTGLQEARDKALEELKNFSAAEPQYKALLAHVKTLTKLMASEKSEKLSPNTLAIVLGNAFITLVVVGYESKNVVNTKVLPFLTKVFNKK